MIENIINVNLNPNSNITASNPKSLIKLMDNFSKAVAELDAKEGQLDKTKKNIKEYDINNKSVIESINNMI
jgi:hypothetical protein